jgi:hypothetical protein
LKYQKAKNESKYEVMQHENAMLTLRKHNAYIIRPLSNIKDKHNVLEFEPGDSQETQCMDHQAPFQHLGTQGNTKYIESSLVNSKHMPSNIKTTIIFPRNRMMGEITEKRHLIPTKRGTVQHYMLNLHISFEQISL